MCRKQITWLGIPSDVKFYREIVLLHATYRNEGCNGLVCFKRQCADGIWEVKKVVGHDIECVRDLRENPMWSGQTMFTALYNAENRWITTSGIVTKLLHLNSTNRCNRPIERELLKAAV